MQKSFLKYPFMGIFLVVTSLSVWGSEAIHSDDSRERLIRKIVPYTILSPDQTTSMKEMLKKYSLEKLERMEKLAPVLLKDRKDENLKKYASLTFLVDMLGQVSSDDQEVLIQEISAQNLITYQMSLKERKRQISPLIQNIKHRYDKPFFKDGQIFEIGHDLTLLYKEAFHANLLPMSFRMSLDENDKKLILLQKTVPAFLVLKEGTTIGCRLFTISKDALEGEAYVMAKDYRGKGLGKIAFMSIIRLWATDPHLGRRKHIVLRSVTESGRGLIKSVIREGLIPEKEEEEGCYWEVTFNMSEIKKIWTTK